jgi:hypothetical protein
MNRLQLAVMDFNLEIRLKKVSEMPADLLSRSFKEISAISAIDIDWVHEQEKDNLSTLIKESLNKDWTYRFPMPEWYMYTSLTGEIHNSCRLLTSIC